MYQWATGYTGWHGPIFGPRTMPRPSTRHGGLFRQTDQKGPSPIGLCLARARAVLARCSSLLLCTHLAQMGYKVYSGPHPRAHHSCFPFLCGSQHKDKGCKQRVNRVGYCMYIYKLGLHLFITSDLVKIGKAMEEKPVEYEITL